MSAPSEAWVRLGQGIDSPTGIPTTTVCMKDATNPSAFSNPAGHISFTDVISQTQLKQYFN